MSLSSAPSAGCGFPRNSTRRRSQASHPRVSEPAVQNTVSKSFVRTIFPRAVQLRDYIISIDASLLPAQSSMSADLSALLDETIVVPPNTPYLSFRPSLSRAPSSSSSSGERAIKPATPASTSVAAVINRLVASEVRCAGGGGHGVSSNSSSSSINASTVTATASTTTAVAISGAGDGGAPQVLDSTAAPMPSAAVPQMPAAAGGGGGGGDNILALGYRPKVSISEMDACIIDKYHMI